MNPLSHLNPIEQSICDKADLNKIPISGNIELLPLCNMDCKMCFAKMTKQEMEAHSPMHNYEEWLSVAKQMSDAGTVFLLLTGGEPFLYPNFKKLYLGLKKMGFVVSINTNGTLINEEIADYLASDPPRRLNITLYGTSNETYAKLCGNPIGFTQVMNAVKILKERNIAIKFNCSATPFNIDEIEDIYKIGHELNIPVETAYYMTPAIRKNNIKNKEYRLSPQRASEVKLLVKYLTYGEDVFKEYVKATLDRYKDLKNTKYEYKPGFTCRAGHSVFWINYDGTMTACSFTKKPQYNIFKKDFISCWNDLISEVSKTYLSKECNDCDLKTLCTRCAASAYAETGKYDGTTEYHCELTKNYLKLLKQKAKEYKLYENKF